MRAWRGYRVQSFAPSPSQHRLLSPRDAALLVGSRAACVRAFDQIFETLPQEPERELVVLLHGLGRTSRSLRTLRHRLSDAGYATLALDYASTRGDVPQHAAHLADALAALPPRTATSFVTHSLGGIVARTLLTEHAERVAPLNPRRLFMIAPPSQGARVAARLDSAPFRAVFGPSGSRMARVHAGHAPSAIAAPTIPFAVIAGTLRAGRGVNPLIDGDDDGVVAVDEARLPGAALFALVRAPHTFIMDHPETIAHCLAFLGRDD
ncbi:MAG: alpha/beta hydrolase [Polyangiales bacterium]